MYTFSVPLLYLYADEYRKLAWGRLQLNITTERNWTRKTKQFKNMLLTLNRTEQTEQSVVGRFKFLYWKTKLSNCRCFLFYEPQNSLNMLLPLNRTEHLVLEKANEFWIYQTAVVSCFMNPKNSLKHALTIEQSLSELVLNWKPSRPKTRTSDAEIAYSPISIHWTKNELENKYVYNFTVLRLLACT